MRNNRRGISTAHILAIPLTVLLASCMDSLVDTAEIRRVTSPNGRYDAVLFARDAGATTSTAYDLVVVSHGGSLEENEPAITADKLGEEEKIELKWQGNTLNVHWPTSRLFRHESTAQVSGQTIAINASFEPGSTQP